VTHPAAMRPAPATGAQSFPMEDPNREKSPGIRRSNGFVRRAAPAALRGSRLARSPWKVAHRPPMTSRPLSSKDLTQGPSPGMWSPWPFPSSREWCFRPCTSWSTSIFVAGLGDAALGGMGSAGQCFHVVHPRSRRCWAWNRGARITCRRKEGSGRSQLNLQSVGTALRESWESPLSFAGYGLTNAVRTSLAAMKLPPAGRNYLSALVPARPRPAVCDGRHGLWLRATGIVKPTMMVQVLTVVLNIVFARSSLPGGEHTILSEQRSWIREHAGYRHRRRIPVVLLRQARHFVALDRSMGAPLRTWKRITEYRAAGRRRDAD